MSPLSVVLFSPALGALMGFAISRLTIELLFAPIRPTRVLGITFQGLIPRRKVEIATRIAEAVERDLITREKIARALGSIPWEAEARAILDRTLREGRTALALARLPLLGRAWETLAVPRLVDMLSGEVTRLLDRHQEAFTAKVKDALDVREMVAARIRELEERGLEPEVFAAAKREFRTMEGLAALVGSAFGLFAGALSLLFR